ncbi:MAG: putative zinc-binding metallopeptidase [Ectothiorhodospira sp.]
MKIFNCGACGQLIYFGNTACTRCGHTLGFLPDTTQLAALEPAGEDLWHPVGEPERTYRMCIHYRREGVCNWMIPAEEPSEAFCAACRLNEVIPDLGVEGNMTLWYRMEAEKRRLVYSLLRLGLPVTPRSRDPAGLAFAFLADPDPSIFYEVQRVMSGHNSGLITLNIAEADPAQRERLRQEMAEPYRTILGHFRHESGHYYWDRLVRDTPWIAPFRDCFGDETLNYQQALQAYYASGPPADWRERFISAYSSSHPWEDWAETWTHYLHIVDTLETAHQWGLQVRLTREPGPVLRAAPDFDPYTQEDFGILTEHWLPLSYALNMLNESMGHPPAYPFVLPRPALEKLALVNRIIHGRERAPPAPA